MGNLIKFLLVFAAFYFLFRAFSKWLFGRGQNRTRSPYQPREEAPKQPETQEDRILEYQKKNFESSDAVDVDFEEIKGA